MVLDTETTGLDPRSGHRIVEVGVVEIDDLEPTGREYHSYINPERSVPPEAGRIHRLESGFLEKQPKFRMIASEFLGFLGDNKIVAHNAEFDLSFVNMELERAGRKRIDVSRTIDTLGIAKRKLPRLGRYDLDRLCVRFGIDNSQRDVHGALVDARLLADVYRALMTLDQKSFQLDEDMIFGTRREEADWKPGPRPRPLAARITDEEAAAHEAFVMRMGSKALWLQGQGD